MQYTCKSYLTLFKGLDLTRIRAGYKTGRSLVYLSRGIKQKLSLSPILGVLIDALLMINMGFKNSLVH